MRVTERVAIYTVGGLFFLFFFSGVKTTFYTQGLDSAFMVEMVDTTLERGAPLTRLTKSVILAIDTVLTRSPEAVCAQPLAPESPELMNEFKRHAFTILYLTVPFR